MTARATVIERPLELAPGTAMKLAVRQVGDVTVVDFSGRAIDTDGAVRDAMARLLDEGHRRIVFNFAALEYLDSTALGELVACQLRAIRAGRLLKLANAGRRISHLLVMTRLITVFDSYDTLDAALGSFRRLAADQV
jgi:anti-sigma B factor antagonist